MTWSFVCVCVCVCNVIHYHVSLTQTSKGTPSVKLVGLMSIEYVVISWIILIIKMFKVCMEGSGRRNSTASYDDEWWMHTQLMKYLWREKVIINFLVKTAWNSIHLVRLFLARTSVKTCKNL